MTFYQNDPKTIEIKNAGKIPANLPAPAAEIEKAILQRNNQKKELVLENKNLQQQAEKYQWWECRMRVGLMVCASILIFSIGGYVAVALASKVVLGYLGTAALTTIGSKLAVAGLASIVGAAATPLIGATTRTILNVVENFSFFNSKSYSQAYLDSKDHFTKETLSKNQIAEDSISGLGAGAAGGIGKLFKPFQEVLAKSRSLYAVTSGGATASVSQGISSPLRQLYQRNELENNLIQECEENNIQGKAREELILEKIKERSLDLQGMSTTFTKDVTQAFLSGGIGGRFELSRLNGAQAASKFACLKVDVGDFVSASAIGLFRARWDTPEMNFDQLIDTTIQETGNNFKSVIQARYAVNPESARRRGERTIAKNLDQPTAVESPARVFDDTQTFRSQNADDFSVIATLTVITHYLNLIPSRYVRDPRTFLNQNEVQQINRIAAVKDCPYPEQSLRMLAMLEKAAEVYLVDHPPEMAVTQREIHISDIFGTMTHTISLAFLHLSAGDLSLGKNIRNVGDVPHLRKPLENAIALVAEVNTANGRKVIGCIHSHAYDTTPGNHIAVNQAQNKISGIHIDNITMLPPYDSRLLVKEWCQRIVTEIFSSPLNINTEITATVTRHTAYTTAFPIIFGELRKLRPDLNFVLEEVSHKGVIKIKIKPSIIFDYQPLIESLSLIPESSSRKRAIDSLLQSKNIPDSKTRRLLREAVTDSLITILENPNRWLIDMYLPDVKKLLPIMGDDIFKNPPLKEALKKSLVTAIKNLKGDAAWCIFQLMQVNEIEIDLELRNRIAKVTDQALKNAKSKRAQFNHSNVDLDNTLDFIEFDLAWCNLIRTIALGEERLAKNQISHLYIWVHPEYRDFGICDNEHHWQRTYKFLDELTENPQCALAVCSWLPQRDIASVRRRAKEEWFTKDKTERYLKFVEKQEEFYREAQKRLGNRFIFWPTGMIDLNNPSNHYYEVDYLGNIFNIDPRCFDNYNQPLLLQYADCFGLLPTACVAVQAQDCGLQQYVLETNNHGTMAPPPDYRGE